MKYFTPLFIILFSLTVQTQEKKINYQFNLGTNVSIPYKRNIVYWPEFEGSPEINYRSGVGCFTEFSLSYNINERLSLSPGLQFSFSKLRFEQQSNLVSTTGTIQNSYINIPILIRYHLLGKNNFSVAAGSYISVILDAKEKGTYKIDTANMILAEFPDPAYYEIDPVQEFNFNCTRQYKSFDFGLLAQIEYRFNISNNINSTIFTRFNLGLPDVITEKADSRFIANKWRNYNLLVGIGIGF